MMKTPHTSHFVIASLDSFYSTLYAAPYIQCLFYNRRHLPIDHSCYVDVSGIAHPGTGCLYRIPSEP